MCINCLTADERNLALQIIDRSVEAIEKRETIPYEADMLELVYAGWISATHRGLKAAMEFIHQVSTRMTQDDLQVIMEVLRSETGPTMAKDMRDGLLSLFGKSYLNGKAISLDQQLLDVSFSLRDEVSVNWLTDHHTYWIGNYFDKNISNAIAETVTSGLEQGLGRDEVGNLLRDFFDDYPGVPVKPQNYWSGLAGSAMNRSRNFGLIRGYKEVDIAELEIVALDDELTCPICGEMNGKIIPVGKAYGQVERMIATENPEDVRAVSPWLSFNDISGLDIGQIMDKGMILPPFHFSCRCTVVSYFRKMRGDLSRHFRRAA
ncbi:MAG: hypothetical protein WBP42_02550 [Candidatus Zixiibacteriota bacterium]